MKSRTGDYASIAAMILCVALTLLCLTAFAGEKRYERKCRKAAQRVEKSVQRCPSLQRERIDTVLIPQPEIELIFLTDTLPVNCDSCEFSVTHKTDTVIVEVVKRIGGKLRTNVTIPARVDTVIAPCTEIVSANADLAKALDRCREQHMDNAVVVATCEDRIKRANRDKWWWILACVGLGLGHVFRTKGIRKLIFKAVGL